MWGRKKKKTFFCVWKYKILIAHSEKFECVIKNQWIYQQIKKNIHVSEVMNPLIKKIVLLSANNYVYPPPPPYKMLRSFFFISAVCLGDAGAQQESVKKNIKINLHL